MALTDRQYIDLVNQEFEDSIGAPGGDVDTARQRAYDYYLSEPFGDEQEGESRVVTSDVADVVDGLMPSLLRLFTTQENLVSFDAHGPEDEAQARQESDYVNYVFWKRNPAFEVLYSWFFDALVQMNGYVKCYWDESERVTQDSWQELTELELADLMSDPELELLERDERMITVQGEDGQPFEVLVHDVTFERTETVGRVVVENVPPEEMRISRDSRSVDPTGARMVGQERDDVKRHELLAMGFDHDLVMSLKPESVVTTDSQTKTARRALTDDETDGATSIDRMQDGFKLREAYLIVDDDGDGVAELMQVFTAGDKLLEKSRADRQPFHSLCPHPLPHKHVGRASAQKVMDTQRIGSELWRQILTNLYHTNRPSHAVWELGMGENTMEDLLTTRIGRVTRFRRPVQESYQPMTVPFTAGASFPMLELIDKAKRDRTGISADSEGLNPEALKNIQTSVLAQASDISRMRIEAIARIFAETGIKSLMLHIRELLSKHQVRAEVVRLRGEYVTVDPQSWRHRADTTVNIGLGIGTREQNLLHLETIWAKQLQMAESGQLNLTVTPQNLFQTAREVVRNANLRNPDRFFTDPGEQPAPPPSDQAQELQRMQLEVQQRQQQLDQERNQINMAKLQLANEKQQLEHQREVVKLQGAAQEREQRFAIENTKLRNQLTGLLGDMQSSSVKDQLAAAKTQAEVQKILADALKARAETAKIMEEVDSQSMDNVEREAGITGSEEQDASGGD